MPFSKELFYVQDQHPGWGGGTQHCTQRGPRSPHTPRGTLLCWWHQQDHPSARQSSAAVTGAESRSRGMLEASHCWWLVLIAGGLQGPKLWAKRSRSQGLTLRPALMAIPRLQGCVRGAGSPRTAEDTGPCAPRRVRSSSPALRGAGLVGERCR